MLDSKKPFNKQEVQFEHLRQENDALSEQVVRLTEEVKRLTRTESKLYQMQKRLDKQIQSYQAINEFCKKLNVAVSLPEVYEAIIEFILYEINLEKCLIFLNEPQRNIFSVQALDGYYEDSIYKKFSQLEISKADLQLDTLLESSECIICPEEVKNPLIIGLRDIFFMQEYVLFIIGENKQKPLGLLVAGNSEKMANYQTRVTAESDFLIYLSNLAYQVSIALKKTLFYEELQTQKEDLKKAVFELNLKKIRLETTLQDLDEARSMATRDSLTGVFNRTYFDSQLPEEFDQAKLGGYSVSVVLIDIDFFKSINDNFGHPVGDIVLRRVGQLLKEHTEKGGIAFRYGGEEFILVLPGISSAMAYAHAENIRACFQDLVFQVNTREISATLSAGVSSGPEGCETFEDLVRRADEALYKAKSLGRNRVEIFT